jgi:hypothetical protein
MHGNRGFFVVLMAACLLTASVMALPIATAQGKDQVSAAALQPAPTDPDQGAACGDETLDAVAQHATTAPPGCCSTQCNVDKDCNKICGRGVCACIQQTPCCRRCVY